MAFESSIKHGMGPGADVAVHADLGIDAFLMVAGERLRASILALSGQEVRLCSPEPLLTGETVELEFGEGIFALVKICWSRGLEAGGSFLGFE